MEDFAREITGNAGALARSINGMYPCRRSESYLIPIPLLWHERIRVGMDGRGEAKHSHVACLSHALLSMMMLNHKRHEFLVYEVLIAPLSASARAAEVRWLSSWKNGSEKTYEVNGCE